MVFYGEMMTKKRFTETVSIETVYDNKTGEEFHPVILSDGLLRKLNNLDARIIELEKQLDTAIDVINQLMDQKQKCHNEILKIKKEHRESDFQLHTLKKFYTCPNCAFNERELKYIKKLMDDKPIIANGGSQRSGKTIKENAQRVIDWWLNDKMEK